MKIVMSASFVIMRDLSNSFLINSMGLQLNGFIFHKIIFMERINFYLLCTTIWSQAVNNLCLSLMIMKLY